MEALSGIETGCAFGMEEVMVEDRYYRWEAGSLHILMNGIWLEFPTVRKRRLIIEGTHLDFVHIGSDKMTARI